MRNITYENVSENPDTSARTVRFVLTDGDAGTSNAETETINVSAVNDDPTNAGSLPSDLTFLKDTARQARFEPDRLERCGCRIR